MHDDFPVLVLKNVIASYGGPHILDAISLTVPRGKLITVVGPNGHGKSTLLRTVSGLTQVISGTITVCGHDLGRMAPHKIVSLGVAHVPQGDLLFSDMTVNDNLAMGAYLVSDAIEIQRRYAEVFDLFPKLADRRQQIASTLSGGERRMVGIGRGLMMGAALMLIDEPSLGLAPLVIDQIYSAIASLRESGRSILLVEENPARVADLTDEMHLLDDGEIIWSGPPRELLERDELLATYLGG